MGNLVGIDIGGTKIDIALADPQARVLHRTRLTTDAEAGPAQALDRITVAVWRLRHWSQSEYGTPVVAIGAVCPGVVRSNAILFSPNLPGWDRIGLNRELSGRLGMDQVPSCNDVQAGALAELRFGALRGADPGIYVSLGTGLAAALTVGGRIVGGAHGASGEIAYSMPVGRAAGAVRRGDAPLEQLVGGRALSEQASALLGESTSASALFRREDGPSKRLVSEALDTLASAVSNLASFIDPERIVIGGGMIGSAAAILPAIRGRLDQLVPFPPALSIAHFKHQASLHGALALAFDLARDTGSDTTRYSVRGGRGPSRTASGNTDPGAKSST